jgi:hypothetical protein
MNKSGVPAAASNIALERTAGSHSLAAAAHRERYADLRHSLGG